MATEKEYFCNCLQQCEKGMYALALGILKNENDVADVMQDTILKAYCNFHTLKDKNKFKQWIMTILHNTAIDYIYKRQNSEDIENNDTLYSNDNVSNSETKITVWQAVNKLKLPYRTVIILFYYEDYSIKQIAEITSTPSSNVRQQLSRGRKMLAKFLNKEDFT